MNRPWPVLTVLFVLMASVAVAEGADQITVDTTAAVLAAVVFAVSAIVSLILKLTNLGDWIERRRIKRLRAWAEVHCPAQHGPVLEQVDALRQAFGLALAELKTLIIERSVHGEIDELRRALQDLHELVKGRPK